MRKSKWLLYVMMPIASAALVVLVLMIGGTFDQQKNAIQQRCESGNELRDLIAQTISDVAHAAGGPQHADELQARIQPALDRLLASRKKC
jgi:hypothetical protein